ncbi:MAG: DUF2520 domain-containing protein [Deltaproteobacteria bacterium]|nr:DUF2520 domain-containing protein [Deltaproteobacteria bacterium]
MRPSPPDETQHCNPGVQGSKPPVVIVGCGTVGTALGRLLAASGYPIEGVITRSPSTARRAAARVGARAFSDRPTPLCRQGAVVFITTPDDAIKKTCDDIAAHAGFQRETVVIHCSGALSSEVLASARGCHALVASLHPLQSFASAEQAERILPGSYCTIEGDVSALGVVSRLVKDLGGIAVEIKPEAKALYHAAAVVASNYLVTLLDIALTLNRLAGIAPEAAFEALLPLIQGTLQNIHSSGIPQALTGPIARGDIQTVAGHLEAMSKQAPDVLAIYKSLGCRTVTLARAKGTLGDRAARELLNLLGC